MSGRMRRVPWLRTPDNHGYRWLGRPDFPTMKIVVGRALALRAPDKELPDRRRRLYENLPKPAVLRLIEEARSKRSECTPLTDRRRGLAKGYHLAAPRGGLCRVHDGAPWRRLVAGVNPDGRH